MSSRNLEESHPADEMSLKDMVVSGMFNHAVEKYRELCRNAGVPCSRQVARKHIRDMEKESKKSFVSAGKE